MDFNFENITLDHKSGMVAVIGRPNVGKSTLINTIMNKKISIVSAKPNTTRNEIHAIYDNTNYQIIFVDTPGINNIHDSVGVLLNKVAISGIKDADIIVIMFAADQICNKEDLKNISIINNLHSKAFIIAAISKIDTISKSKLILKLEEISKLYKWDEVIPLSAMKNNNIETLLNIIKSKLPLGPKYYDPKDATNVSQNFLIKEIIREKCFLLLNKELPYSIVVELLKIIKNNNKLIIYANIITEKKSQKPIIIGNKGEMIKKISILARKELEETFKMKIYLELYVKVNPKWKYSQNSILEYLNPND